jgi:hypothetical protein
VIELTEEQLEFIRHTRCTHTWRALAEAFAKKYGILEPIPETGEYSQLDGMALCDEAGVE